MKKGFVMPSPEEVIAAVEKTLEISKRDAVFYPSDGDTRARDDALRMVAHDELILKALRAYTGKPVAWLITGDDEKLTVYTKAYADYYESLNRSVTPLCPSLAEEGQSSHLQLASVDKFGHIGEGEPEDLAGDKPDPTGSSSPVRTSERKE